MRGRQVQVAKKEVEAFKDAKVGKEGELLEILNYAVRTDCIPCCAYRPEEKSRVLFNF